MKSLFGATLVTPYRLIPGGTVEVEGATIQSVGASQNAAGQERIDLTGLYVSPGFIDMHIHGGGGHRFWSEDPEEILAAGLFHAQHGVTAVVPTVGLSEQLTLDEETRARFDAFRVAAQDKRPGPELLGLHIEGPFASPGQPMAAGQGVIPAEPAQYDAFLDACPQIIRWTVAPEIPGVPALISELMRRGVAVSLGHSEAPYDLICEAYERGVRQITHLYSGMQSVHRIHGHRFPGLVEAAYLLDEFDVEMIANGSHLSGELMRLVMQNKGPGHVCVVSDATPLSGHPDGPIAYEGQNALIQDGVILREDRNGFLGSAITFDCMLRNLVHRANIGLADAVRMCATTPARALGLGRRKGVLAAGFDADLIAFDRELEIRFVMARGEILCDNR